MPFVPKKQAFNAHINEVVLGVGEKATAIGGQNVLPFHTFDAEIKNAPKIGVELTDFGMSEYTMPGEQAFYAGCETVVDMAKRAETCTKAVEQIAHYESRFILIADMEVKMDKLYWGAVVIFAIGWYIEQRMYVDGYTRRKRDPYKPIDYLGVFSIGEFVGYLIRSLVAPAFVWFPDILIGMPDNLIQAIAAVWLVVMSIFVPTVIERAIDGF